MANRLIDALTRTPAIEELTPTDAEWDSCKYVGDRYALMKRKLRAAFALAPQFEEAGEAVAAGDHIDIALNEDLFWAEGEKLYRLKERQP